MPDDPAKEAMQRVLDAGLVREATDEELEPIVAKVAAEIREAVDNQVIGEIELDISGRVGTLDELKETEGYTRNCRSCGAAMKVQTWSSTDGAHEDSKYVCPKDHVEWVDGIDS